MHIKLLHRTEKERRVRKTDDREKQGGGYLRIVYDSSPFNLFLLIPVSVAWFAISLYQDFMNVLFSHRYSGQRQRNNTSNTRILFTRYILFEKSRKNYAEKYRAFELASRRRVGAAGRGGEEREKTAKHKWLKRVSTRDHEFKMQSSDVKSIAPNKKLCKHPTNCFARLKIIETVSWSSNTPPPSSYQSLRRTAANKIIIRMTRV